MTQQPTTRGFRFALPKLHVLISESPFFIFAFLLTTQFSVASSARVATFDSPQVVIETTSRDFGEVFAGEELECSFTVRNTGTKPLELAEKSTIPSRSTGLLRAPSPAMGRIGERLFTRVAMTRAAPS